MLCKLSSLIELFILQDGNKGSGGIAFKGQVFTAYLTSHQGSGNAMGEHQKESKCHTMGWMPWKHGWHTHQLTAAWTLFNRPKQDKKKKTAKNSNIEREGLLGPHLSLWSYWTCWWGTVTFLRSVATGRLPTPQQMMPCLRATLTGLSSLKIKNNCKRKKCFLWDDDTGQNKYFHRPVACCFSEPTEKKYYRNWISQVSTVTSENFTN